MTRHVALAGMDAPAQFALAELLADTAPVAVLGAPASAELAEFVSRAESAVVVLVIDDDARYWRAARSELRLRCPDCAVIAWAPAAGAVPPACNGEDLFFVATGRSPAAVVAAVELALDLAPGIARG